MIKCDTCYFKDSGCEGYGTNRDCGFYKPIDWKPKNESEEIQELLSLPVSCEDGRMHYIDESNKRFLSRVINQLFKE